MLDLKAPLARTTLAIVLLLALVPSCGGDDGSAEPSEPLTCQLCVESDAGNDAATAPDVRERGDDEDALGDEPDVEQNGTGHPSPLQATESYEAEVLYGWLVAGQPSEARVTELVGEGAVIFTLRPAAEDPFDEETLVAELAGTFVRYPTTGADYQSTAFREALYDLYDWHLEAGDLLYIHCASGNRAGASWALYQAERKGVPTDEAIEMGKAAGLSSLESMVRGILEG